MPPVTGNNEMKSTRLTVIDIMIENSRVKHKLFLTVRNPKQNRSLKELFVLLNRNPPPFDLCAVEFLENDVI
jgi:hypothetical protein